MENEPHSAHHDTGTTHTKKKEDLSIPLAIILAGALIGGAIFYSNNTQSGAAMKRPVAPEQQVDADTQQIPATELALRSDDHVLGNQNADVLVIEYSDTECPFCKKFHETMLEVMDQYRKAGTVAWVYRHYPLDQLHPKAHKEAEALECANAQGGNEAFWTYAAKLFAVTPSNNGLDSAELPKIASDIGLNVASFNTCLTSGTYAARVDKDIESGVNVGAKGTPYSVVWNKKTGKQMPIEGAYPLLNVRNIIETVLYSEAATK